MNEKQTIAPELFSFLGALPPETLISIVAIVGVVLIATLSIMKGTR